MSFRTIARFSILSAIALAGAGAANAGVFLKVSSIQGDSNQRGFEGQIQVSSASMSVSTFQVPNPDGGGDTVRNTSVGPIYISKAPDRASPKMVSDAVEGMPWGRIEITFTSDDQQTILSRWIIDGAEVHSYSVNPDGAAGNKPVESIEIGYASMTYQYFAPGAKPGAKPVSEAKFDVPPEQLFPGDLGCQ